MELPEKKDVEVELLANLSTYLKIKLKDSKPPCMIRFKGLGKKQDKNFVKVFISDEVRDPNENQCYDQKLNVSRYFRESNVPFVA